MSNKTRHSAKQYPEDSVRLFKSDFLEKFTHVHPITPLILWTPIIVALIYRSFAIDQVSGLDFGILALFGLLIWTLTEYLFHRFAFHFDAQSAMGKRFVYVLHGLHHDDPQDPTRLVMPPLPGLIYGGIFFLFFRFLIGPRFVDAFFSFFLVGYLTYDYIHYYVHHFNPKAKVGRFLKQYHMVHHFAEHDAKWGVSNPLWDYVFGTAEQASKERPSPKDRVMKN